MPKFTFALVSDFNLMHLSSLTFSCDTTLIFLLTHRCLVLMPLCLELIKWKKIFTNTLSKYVIRIKNYYFEWMCRNEHNKINLTHPIMQAIALCTEEFCFVTVPVFLTLIWATLQSKILTMPKTDIAENMNSCLFVYLINMEL